MERITAQALIERLADWGRPDPRLPREGIKGIMTEWRTLVEESFQRWLRSRGG